MSSVVEGAHENVVMSLLLHMDGSPEPAWVGPLTRGVALAHGKKVSACN